MRLLAICMLMFLLHGCKEELGREGDVIVSYQEMVTRQFGDQSWAVSFNSIEEHSLCPDEVVCIWLGRLVVTLEINGRDYVLGYGDLTTNNEEGILSQVVVGGMLIELAEAFDTKEPSTTKIRLAFSTVD